MIEVERRGLLDEDQYKRLHALIMACNGLDLGENNTKTDFYLADSFQVKVQHATSKKTAKIAWKSGGNGGYAAREEVEVHIPADELPAARLLVSRLASTAKHFVTNQDRHDFRIGNVHIALKFSDDWGYHIEFEEMVSEPAGTEEAEEAIAQVARQLNVTLLSAKEFTQAHRSSNCLLTRLPILQYEIFITRFNIQLFQCLPI